MSRKWWMTAFLVLFVVGSASAGVIQFQFAPAPVKASPLGVYRIPVPGPNVDRRCNGQESQACRTECGNISNIGTPNPPTQRAQVPLSCDVHSSPTGAFMVCQCTNPGNYT